MKKYTKRLLASVLLAATAGTAQAASISFHGGGGNNYSSAWNFDDGAGISVTVTTADSGKDVAWMTNGLGVGSNLFNQDFSSGESMHFQFSETVTLAGIDFQNWEGCCDDVAVIEIDGNPVSLTYSGSGDLWTFAAPIEMDGFTLKDTGSGVSIYRVEGLMDVTAAPEVPVPAAAWLFGSALVGLAAIGRKRG